MYKVFQDLLPADLFNPVFHLLPLPYTLGIPIYQLPLVLWMHHPCLFLQTCTCDAPHHYLLSSLMKSFALQPSQLALFSLDVPSAS